MLGVDCLQVVLIKYYFVEDCFYICIVGDVIKVIDIIVEQGEGISEGVYGGFLLDFDGEFVYYYCFVEFYYGWCLVKDESVFGGYFYSGFIFFFEVDGLWWLEFNIKVVDLLEGSV